MLGASQGSSPSGDWGQFLHWRRGDPYLKKPQAHEDEAFFWSPMAKPGPLAFKSKASPGPLFLNVFLIPTRFKYLRAGTMSSTILKDKGSLYLLIEKPYLHICWFIGMIKSNFFLSKIRASGSISCLLQCVLYVCKILSICQFLIPDFAFSVPVSFSGRFFAIYYLFFFFLLGK